MVRTRRGHREKSTAIDRIRRINWRKRDRDGTVLGLSILKILSNVFLYASVVKAFAKDHKC